MEAYSDAEKKQLIASVVQGVILATSSECGQLIGNLSGLEQYGERITDISKFIAEKLISKIDA